MLEEAREMGADGWHCLKMMRRYVRGLLLLEKEWVQRVGMALERRVGWVVVGSNPLTFRASVSLETRGGVVGVKTHHLSI